MDLFDLFQGDWRKETDVHVHVLEERADLFRSGPDGSATELEYLSLLYGLVCATKPMCILETGTAGGFGTHFLSIASRDYSGQVHTVDVGDMEIWVRGVPNITFHLQSSLDFIRETPLQFDFAFLDSHLSTRAVELELLINLHKIRSGSIVCIHDTSRLRKSEVGSNDEFYRKFDTLRPMLNAVLEFPLSRGMIVCQVK